MKFSTSLYLNTYCKAGTVVVAKSSFVYSKGIGNPLNIGAIKTFNRNNLLGTAITATESNDLTPVPSKLFCVKLNLMETWAAPRSFLAKSTDIKRFLEARRAQFYYNR